ncbi:hypothetical protein [Streptomyces sp. NPDC005141]
MPSASDEKYLGSPTDALFEPVRPVATSPAGHGLTSSDLAAVGTLSWQDIAKVCQDDAVTRRRNDFQNALRAADAAADDDLSALLRTVRTKLPTTGGAPRQFAWAAAEAGLGLAGAGLALGAGETLGLVAPALAFGLAAEKLLRGSRKRSHIVNTLMKAGRRGTWTQRGDV